MLSAAVADVPKEPRLERRSYVVTGANTGVGRATARALAARGASVTLACRSRERAEGALAELDALGEAGALAFVELDLASLDSVRRAARALAGQRIDALINNAGVGGARGCTADGFELAFGTNHLGHALFTLLTLPQLVDGGRVVHLGSGSYRSAASLDYEALRQPTRSWTGVAEYARSKLAVMLFHHALTSSLTRGVFSVVADPGDVASDAYRHLPQPLRMWWTRGMKAPEAGALTPVFCATSDAVTHGASYVDCEPFEPADHARDAAAASQLWDRTLAWIGERSGASR